MEDALPRPMWKNPYLLGFLIGIAALTLLPFLQKRMLRAPPPLKHLSAFGFPTTGGERISSEQLAGAVWVAGFVPTGCDASCLQLQRDLQQVLKATSDLTQPVRVVSFVALEEVQGNVAPELAALAVPGKWDVAYGTYSQLSSLYAEFQDALNVFRGEGARGVPPRVQNLPGYVLVDQNGDVRGFWGPDELARGNLINAARMLNRYGPNP